LTDKLQIGQREHYTTQSDAVFHAPTWSKELAHRWTFELPAPSPPGRLPAGNAESLSKSALIAAVLA
jgi:hypothetical protein